MSAVEDRIVAMKFDNTQFDPKVKNSMSILDKLKAALNLQGAGKGLNDLQASANKFSLGGLTNAASGVGGKFSAMSVAAVAAIATIVSKAVDAGIRIAKAFTLEPLKAGFQEYETGLNSVQTILANTQAAGTGLKEVNATLKELNTYSDQTIYNFGEMAKNIGTFTAAGVDLKTATASIKGIANLAALSGSNSQQASTAMYQLSQAISAGRVSLQDWNSVVNAGMGGTVFQRALAQNAEKMGTLSKGAVELKGKMKNVTIEGKSFRESITAKPGEESWLTSDVLTQTLSQFTGDLSKAELAAQGFNDAEIEAIQKMAATAKGAATEVKTATQLIGTLQESAGSGWAQSFQILFGDMDQAKKLFTGVNNVLGGFISRSADARNKMLQVWADNGGRDKLIKSLSNVFNALLSVLKPIQEAFRNMFPPTTGEQLADLTDRFLKFTEKLKISDETADLIRRTFSGLFAVFHIGVTIIKGIAGVLGTLIGRLAGGTGSVLKITAAIGDWLVRLDEAITYGDSLSDFFFELGYAISHPIDSLKILAGAVIGFFKSFFNNPIDTVGSSFGRLGERLKPLGAIFDFISTAVKKMIGFFGKVGSVIAPFIEILGAGFSRLGDTIASALKNGDFSGITDALNTGIFAFLALAIKRFLAGGIKIDPSGGVIKAMKETFGALNDVLGTLQQNIKADTIKKIAIAVAILVASIVVLSLIDSKKLTKALLAISVSFGILLGAMAILEKVTTSAGFIKMPLIASSMIALSTAVLILSAAVKNLSDLDWNELARGLTGVAVILGAIVLTSKGLDKANGPMLRAAAALVPFAIGIKILASAVKDLGSMSWGDMIKGLVGMVGAIVGIGLALKLMPKEMPATMLQILAFAAAVKILASALGDFGEMSWGEIVKGLTAMAGSLTALIFAVKLMPKDVGAKAGGFFILAAAMKVMASALTDLGEMSWGEVVKGITALAGAMTVMVVALNAMKGTIPGSIALTAAAVALALLVPVIATLGSLPLGVLAAGLGAIAAVFVILGVAGVALAEVVPVIFGLAASIALLGAAVALTGVGLLAMATAFSIFVAAASAGGAALLTLINLIPAFMAKFAEGIGAFIVSLAAQQGLIIEAGVKLIGGLLEAVVKIGPQLTVAMNYLVGTLINIVLQNAPRLADAGLQLLISLLRSLGSRMGEITKSGADLIVAFLNGIGKNVGRVVDASVKMMIKFMDAIDKAKDPLLDRGAKLIISFVKSLTKTIRNNEGEMRKAGLDLAKAIISGMTGGISDLAWKVAAAARDMALKAWRAAKNALDINSPSKKFRSLGYSTGEGLEQGIDRSGRGVEKSAENMANRAVDASSKAFAKADDMVSGYWPTTPVITPIIDLSNIARDAAQLGYVLGKAINVDTLFASTAMRLTALMHNGQQANNPYSEGRPATKVDIKLEQTNTSPKALAAGEIYVNTKSLLGQLKGAIDESIGG